MTGVAVLTAYCNSVLSIFLNWGIPSYLTSNRAWLRVMVAVCGIEFAIKASFAGPVPGTDANTPAFGLFSGILLKSCGRCFPSTNSQGPVSSDLDRNHLPAIRM